MSRKRSEELYRFSIEQLKSMKGIFSLLNEKDRDILYLFFVAGKKQKDIEEIIGRSQPLLSYDIGKIRRRLKFAFFINKSVDVFSKFFSEDTIFTEQEMKVLTMMFFSSSFAISSEETGIRQVRIRYLFDRCIRKLEEQKNWEIYEIFITIRANLNLLKRKYHKKTNLSVFIPQ